MSVDLWVEVTEENIERLTDLYLRAYPELDPKYAFSSVKVGKYINYDTSYPTLEIQLDSYYSTEPMYTHSRMVDIEEFMLAVFEHSFNQ